MRGYTTLAFSTINLALSALPPLLLSLLLVAKLDILKNGCASRGGRMAWSWGGVSRGQLHIGGTAEISNPSP
jgi:hypothetical protein